MTLSTEYTDNFGRTSEDTEDNLRTRLTPALALGINYGPLVGRLGFSVSVFHDTRTGDIDFDTGVASLGGLELVYDVTPRLRLSVSDYLSRSDDSLQGDTLSLSDERNSSTRNTLTQAAEYRLDRFVARQYYIFNTVLEDIDTLSHRIGLQGLLAFGRATSASLGYEHLISSSDDTDVTGDSLTAAVARQINPLMSLGITGSVAHRDVKDDDPFVTGTYLLWTAALFGTYQYGPWGFSTSVGYTQILDDSPQDADDGGIFTVTTLSYRFGRLAASVGVDSGFSETFAGATTNVGVVYTQGVHATVSYAVTPFVTAAASGFYRRNEFTGVAGEFKGSTEENVGGTAWISWRIRRWLGFDLGYTHFRGSGSGRREEFVENRVRAALSAGF